MYTLTINVLCHIINFNHRCGLDCLPTLGVREAPWPIGRASDSGARGRGFDPHSGRRVVSLSKIYLPPKKYW